MSIEFIKGDLFDTDCKVIAHQVNCQGVMGSGVALQVKKKHKRAYERYYQLICKIGAIHCKGQHQLVLSDNKLIANLFGQFNYGYDKNQYTDLIMLSTAMNSLKLEMLELELEDIAFPYKMSSDRGGAKWEDVLELIKEHFEKDFTVKIYKL